MFENVAVIQFFIGEIDIPVKLEDGQTAYFRQRVYTGINYVDALNSVRGALRDQDLNNTGYIHRFTLNSEGKMCYETEERVEL